MWACGSVSEGELLWRIDIFLLFFSAKKYRLVWRGLLLQCSWVLFNFNLHLVNIWLDLTGQGELANQIVSFCGGSRMALIWPNPVPKLVTLGQSFAVNIQTWENISKTQRMIRALCKYYHSCEFLCTMSTEYVKLDILFSLSLHIPDESVKMISFLGHVLSGGWYEKEIMCSSQNFCMELQTTKAVLCRMGNTWSSPESRHSLQWDFIIKL